MTDVLEGGCLCGAVRFRATEAPLRTPACHCTFCQKVTGSAYFAESMFPMSAVQFNGGQMRRYEHVSDGSRKKVWVHFCANCGTTVSLTFERWPQVRGMSRGVFDEPDSVTITSHIWTSSAQTGVALPAATDCFAFARASLDGVPAVPEVYEAPRLARGAQP